MVKSSAVKQPKKEQKPVNKDLVKFFELLIKIDQREKVVKKS